MGCRLKGLWENRIAVWGCRMNSIWSTVIHKSTWIMGTMRIIIIIANGWGFELCTISILTLPRYLLLPNRIATIIHTFRFISRYNVQLTNA